MLKVLAVKGGSCIATARSEVLLLFKKPLVGLGKAQGLPFPYDNSSRKNARIFFSSRETLTCVKPRRSATRCCVMLRK